MVQRRFITLFLVASASATAALLLGRAAARSGDTILSVAAALTAFIATIGLLLLARVVLVLERSRRRR